MNLLPRALALALLLVLATLAALLFGMSSRHAAAPAVSAPRIDATTDPLPPPARAAIVSQRVTLPLAITALVLAIGLIASLTLRTPSASGDTRSPFVLARTEVDALARLAESTNQQSAALARERDVRQRAEADALLNQQLLNRSLEEKIRLGRDLHDGIIQSLYAAGLTIESARAVARSDPDEADRRLARCRESLNRTIRDVRAYIAGLAPATLRQEGFTRALQDLVAELGAGRDVRFEMRIDDTATARLTPEQNTETLQIAREAISNSLRHGAASQITVRLHLGEEEICLLVQDNGGGFEPGREPGGGHGLGNMRARADRLGGNLRIESALGKGTRVIFTLPMRRA